MSLRHDLRLFVACVRQGIKIANAGRIVALGSMITYAVIMVMYAGIIRLIPDADLIRFGFTQEQMIWYLGATECIVFVGSSWGFKELQQDILTEQAHLGLLRPGSDVVVRIGLWIGESLYRVTFLFPWFIALMYLLAGAFVPSASQIGGMLACFPLAIFMLAAGGYFVGASCLWFVQAEPAYWIWQKSIFLFGAMMWPIAFYPVWLQTCLWFTPFPGMLAIGGEWTLDVGLQRHLFMFGHQVLWFALFIILLRLYSRAVLRRIQSGEA